MGLVTACTDLDPEIYSNLTTTNAYSTESDIEAAVVGLYSDMNPYPGDAWLYYGGYMIMITDYATDIGYSTAAGDPTKLSNMTYDASNRYFSNNWRDMYNVVSNANTILDNVDAVNMSEEKKNLVKGQAKFLRAMAYRDLTDAWGAVPFITSLVKNPFTMNSVPYPTHSKALEYMVRPIPPAPIIISCFIIILYYFIIFFKVTFSCIIFLINFISRKQVPPVIL